MIMRDDFFWLIELGYFDFDPSTSLCNTPADGDISKQLKHGSQHLTYWTMSKLIISRIKEPASPWDRILAHFAGKTPQRNHPSQGQWPNCLGNRKGPICRVIRMGRAGHGDPAVLIYTIND